MVADPAAITSAVLAGTAAVVSGFSFWFVQRREERVWRRDAMIDTLVVFFDSSFAGIGQRALDTRRSGEDMGAYDAKRSSSHRAQIDALTRLRLIAPDAVVAGAERLHEADHGVHDALLLDTEVPTDEKWNELRRVQSEARDQLLNVSRNALDLGKAIPIGHIGHVGT